MLRLFLTDASPVAATQLMIGEAGVGKTSLLEQSSTMAAERGMRVLRVAGVEFEAEVSFAAIHQLLTPLVGRLPAVDDRSRHALSVALGLAEGVAPDHLTLVNATVALLDACAQEAPLLLTVDDLQWVDHASERIFGLLARRIDGDRIRMIGVVRVGEGSAFEQLDLPALTIGPLTDESSSLLLAERFPELSPSAIGRILSESEGNPLALVELPAYDHARTGGPDAPRTNVGRRLQHSFAQRIAALPADTQWQLLLAALAGQDVSSVGDMREAELAQLVRVHAVTRTVQFRHPLIRATVVDMSTDGERRRAHRLLAEANPPGSERRARHLAEAATEPDEQVAALLEATAHKVKGRGDPVSAIGLLLRAATLSPDADAHHRRAMFAAYLGADVTGDLADPTVSLEPSANQSHTIAEAVAAAAFMVNGGGDIDTICRILLSALHSAGEPAAQWDPPLLEIVFVLQATCSFGSREDLVREYRAALDRIGLPPPEILVLLGDTFLEPAARALPMLDQLDQSIADIQQQSDHAHAVRIGIAAMYLDRLAGCRAALLKVIEHGRAGGAVASAIKAFALLCYDGILTGDWDTVLALGEEGYEVAQRHRYRLLGGFLQYTQAMVAAARGDSTTVQSLADDMLVWAVPNQVGFVQQLAHHAKAIDSLGRNDFDAAYRHALAVCSPETVPAYKPAALWVLFDLVESAVRAGREVDADAHIAAIEASGVAKLSPRLELVARGAQALASHDRLYRKAFDDALAIPGARRWPFLYARIQFAYGERLRRNGAVVDAQHHLLEAEGIFARLGADPWINRTAAELRVCGTTRPVAASDQLTPQERQIAELAASGMTNKQIAKTLYLSPRTVSAHLYHVFPKLGITSRAALRDSLTDG